MSEKVVVYGTLKQGHPNHDVMISAEGSLLGTTTVPNATMFDLGPFPAVSFDDGKGIYGEVYEVKNIDPVDRLEGHPHFYQRHQVDTPYGKAWVYNMHPRRTLGLSVVEEGYW